MGTISDLLLARRLRHSWRLAPSMAEELQAKKLRSVLRHAYDNVAFYHRKFDEAGIKPEDVRTLEDLRKVPPTTKSEVQGSSVEDLVFSTTMRASKFLS